MGNQGSNYYHNYFKDRSFEVPVGTNLKNVSNNDPVWKGKSACFRKMENQTRPRLGSKIL